MSLVNKTTNGIIWNTSSTIIRSFVSLFQVAILTRLLSKEDFGIIAIASVFIGFTQLFLDLGISVGIIHKQNMNREEYSSLFWLNIISGLILTIILIGSSTLIANLYNDKTLIPIIRLLSLSVFFAALGSQHRTVQQKNFRFRYIAIIEIISSIITISVAIILANSGYGVYSLVYSTLSGVILSNVLFLIIGLTKDNNVFFHFKFSETLPFLKIGVYSIGSNILDYFSREIDVIFISTYFGKEILGVYSLCKKIVQMLYNIINPILTKILTPLFATIQADISKIKKVYLLLIESLSIVNLPIFILVSIFSRTILITLYGDSYVSGSFILSVLSLYYGILSLSNPVGSLQIALGRTDIGFYWTIYRVIITIVVVFVSSFYNIETLVLLFLLMSILNTLLSWRYQINILIKIKLNEFVNCIYKPMLLLIIMSIPFYMFLWKSNLLFLSIVLSLLFISLYFLIIKNIVKDAYIIKKVDTQILLLKQGISGFVKNKF